MLDRPSPTLPRLEPAAEIVRTDEAVPDYTYPGGKSLAGVPEWICSHLPSHVYYAEPFAGKGGVFRHKLPALRSILIDEDPSVVSWWDRIRPPGTLVINGDGIRFCELAAEWGPEDLLMYVDPPYMMSARSGKRLYRRELTPADHGRLLMALRDCRCGVAISGYSTPLYESAFSRWHRHSRDVITRGGVMREEVLWVNRLPAPSSVAMEYSALGSNYRERERIHRKAERWASRLKAMPPGERRAVLLRLLDAMREES